MPMKNKTLAQGFALLSTTFPNRDFNPKTLDTYKTLLADLDDDLFLHAIARICREEIALYPDTNIVALIRQYAQGGSKEDLHRRALLAWDAVRKAITEHGYYQSVQFDDPVIHSCIEALGGWQDLCSTPIEEIKWREKRFLELYPAFATTKKEHPQYLVGYVEQQNRLNNYSSEKMKLTTLDPKTQEQTDWEPFEPIPMPVRIETGIPEMLKGKPVRAIKSLQGAR
jgi:hypothetical protein